MWGWPQSPVPPLWPPGGLSSAFSPPVTFSLSTLLFLHLINCFRASTTRCGLCTCIHAQHAGKYSHAHTPLFNHWLCYRGYFPRQCLWRRGARQAEWEGEISLSLITWKPRYWHSHWLRWMNLIYLPFEAQMTSRYGSLSLYRRRSFLFFFAPPVKSGNAQEGMWRDFDRD